jgi:Putative MetA-pathway of phenol degradation
MPRRLLGRILADTRAATRGTLALCGVTAQGVWRALRVNTLGVVVCLGSVGMVSGPCRALDFQPFDWVPAKPGVNALMGYYEYGEYNEYNNFRTGTVTYDTSLDSSVGILRYLHYETIFAHTYVLDLIVPFGTLSNGKIDGEPLGSASGIADPLASVGFWFINEPDRQRYLSGVVFVTLPIGSYDNRRALNLGGNRWQSDLQVDFTQGFLDKFTIDMSGDWISYGNNNKAGTGSQSLSQHATYGAYTWLSCDVTSTLRRVMPTAMQASLSIGYAGTFGGVQKLDGVRTGAKTDEQQIRLSYSQFVTPTWQGVLSLSHDVSASGQFKQNLGVLIRVAKLF